VRGKRHPCRSERPTAGRQSGAARLPGHPLPGVAGRADAAGPRLPSLLPFQAFFRRIREGQTPGYPPFQGATRYTSFTYKRFGNGATLDNGFLVLSKIGRIAVRWSPPLEGAPKTVTVSREADGWYVCFSCAEGPVQPLPPTDQETGIDVGLASFATLASGEHICNPRHYRQAERRLKTAQRRVSRRKKGSHRRRKAVTLLAKAHLKAQRQRADFHHKEALKLAHQHDTIYREDVPVANMGRNHRLAKSISDASWAQFRAILEAKAAYAGRRVVAVPPAYSSQDGSGGGWRVQKSLSVRASARTPSVGWCSTATRTRPGT